MFDNPNKGPVEVDANGNPIPRKGQNRQPINVDIDFSKIIKRGFIPLLLLVLILVAGAASVFTVNEMEQAIIVRFGEVQKVIVADKAELVKEQLVKSGKFSSKIEVVEGKGLFFKMPIIDEVEKYTSQLLTYQTAQGEVVTLDKKKINLDNNAQWRITNPALFRAGVKTVEVANTRLDDQIFSKLREQIGRINGSTLISDKETVYNMTETVKMQVNAWAQSEELGIEVFDIRIARTELPEANNKNIFNRMITERQKMANKLRAEGDEEYKKITANADKEATILTADAYAQSEKIKGEGDATALEIYADAYNKDPEFYQFLKTLETYRESLGANAKIVIDSDSEFARYLFKIGQFND